MKQVYCIMKKSDEWTHRETLVAIFTTEELANKYKEKQRHPNLYRVSSRKVQDKII